MAENDWTPERLFEELKHLRDEESIKEVSQRFNEWIRERYPNKRTLKKVMASYLKLVRTIPLEQGNSYYRDKANGSKEVVHLFFKYGGLTLEEYREINGEYESRKLERIDNGTALNVESYLELTNSLLLSNEYWELATGIMAATGRRQHEIMLRGRFSPLRDGAIDLPESIPLSHWLRFSGQGKKRKVSTELGAYPIAVLFPANFVIEAIKRLRNLSEVKEGVKTWLATVNQEKIKANFAHAPKEIPYQIYLAENDAIDNFCNKGINRVIKSQFGEVLAVRHGKKELSGSSLRAAYAKLATERDCPANKNDLLFAARLLGHFDDDESKDLRAILTTIGYFDYYVEKSAIVPLMSVPSRKGSVERLRVYKNDMDFIKQFQAENKLLNQQEAVSELLILVREAQEYRKQLLKPSVQIKENEIVISREELAATVEQIVDRKLNEYTAKINNVIVEKPVEVVELLPQKDTKDFSGVDSDRLKGSKVPFSAEEKIARAVQAIMDYNDCKATEKSQKWFIGVRSIQELTGSRYDAIKPYLDRTKITIDYHNAKHELTSQHNKKHKEKISDVISW